MSSLKSLKLSSFLFLATGDVAYSPEENKIGIIKESFIMDNKRYYFLTIDEHESEMVFKRGELIRIGEL